MGSDISEELRRRVADRAGYRCEYCLLHEDDSYTPHQIDHVVSRKHGGESAFENLAYACLRCNAWKGSDLTSIDPETGKVVLLFNPRQQQWINHFRPQGFVIEPITAEARATSRLLRLNIDRRVIERRALMLIGRYAHE